MDATTDAYFIAAYLAGDHKAFTKIYNRHSPFLRKMARLKLRDKHACDDILQKVFFIASRKMQNLNDRERLPQWLQQILLREVYRHNGKSRLLVVTDFQSDSPSDQPSVLDPRSEGALTTYEDLRELIRSAADGLGKRDRLILSLIIDEGLEGDDLAGALDVLPDQCPSLVHRMRDQLEKCLDAYCVAKAGRSTCTDLAEILFRWSGRLDVQIRKRILRHLGTCLICQAVRAQHRFTIPRQHP
ncbi:MAG: sigma-70 family RNA polymerase sigma factor [Actinomycetes bacterium]